MDAFLDYVNNVEDELQRRRINDFLEYFVSKYPSLETKIAWKQPMFVDHGTYILGISYSKKHLAVAPEKQALELFASEISAAGYECTANFIKICWDDEVDFDLISKIVDFNIADKKDCTSFWRK